MTATRHTIQLSRVVRVPVERAFATWVDPEAMRHWWGGPSIDCSHAEVDLRPGGQYRIANTMPDGSTIWIVGEYEIVEPPNRLVHTWWRDPDGKHPMPFAGQSLKP